MWGYNNQNVISSDIYYDNEYHYLFPPPSLASEKAVISGIGNHRRTPAFISLYCTFQFMPNKHIMASKVHCEAQKKSTNQVLYTLPPLYKQWAYALPISLIVRVFGKLRKKSPEFTMLRIILCPAGLGLFGQCY